MLVYIPFPFPTKRSFYSLKGKSPIFHFLSLLYFIFLELSQTAQVENGVFSHFEESRAHHT